MGIESVRQKVIILARLMLVKPAVKVAGNTEDGSSTEPMG